MSEGAEKRNAANHFAEDATTGAVGNTPMQPGPTGGASKEGQPPDAHKHNPGLPQHTAEDAGWTPEEPGSALAHEREGVPESEVPHNLPASAARQRRPA
jgi:hypothetical protein